MLLFLLPLQVGFFVDASALSSMVYRNVPKARCKCIFGMIILTPSTYQTITFLSIRQLTNTLFGTYAKLLYEIFCWQIHQHRYKFTLHPVYRTDRAVRVS